MKNYNEMSDHEILMELLEEKRKNDKLKTVKYAIYATILVFIIVVLAIYVPKILRFINNYNDFMNQFSDINKKMDEFLNNFDPSVTKDLTAFIEQLKNLLSRFGF